MRAVPELWVVDLVFLGETNLGVIVPAAKKKNLLPISTLRVHSSAATLNILEFLISYKLLYSYLGGYNYM